MEDKISGTIQQLELNTIANKWCKNDIFDICD